MAHLFTNSQAALFIGDDGMGFIRSVNSIHEMSYLPVIEVLILLLPFAIHSLLGIKYLFQAHYNSFGATGFTPYLPDYPRNRAYTWQRVTSWLLIFGIIAHVVHMRFIEYPTLAKQHHSHAYLVKVSEDNGLRTLSDRLDFKLYTPAEIEKLATLHPFHDEFINAMRSIKLKRGELVASAADFGTAELLIVRDAFKSPLMMVLYTFLVIAACYHAFNGLGTFMIKWGVTLSIRSQQLMRLATTCLMLLFIFLGLAAVWLTYWVNLKV
jgi:succinate dehydrogenase / fumarate reductase cytochrome b subunit